MGHLDEWGPGKRKWKKWSVSHKIGAVQTKRPMRNKKIRVAMFLSVRGRRTENKQLSYS